MKFLFIIRIITFNSVKLISGTEPRKTIRWKPTIVLCILSLLIFSFLRPQSLEFEWERYLSLNTQLQNAARQVKSLQELQNNLYEKKQKLEKEENWFNGWIVNMQLSGINHSLVKTADSLNIVRQRIIDYQNEKDRTLQSIKHHYEEFVSGISGNDLNKVRPARTKEMTGLLNKSVFDSFVLPDYAELVNSLGQDERLKLAIFQDLSRILKTKMNFIDSLLIQKENDLKLYRALQDFHQDIRLQSNADLEISTSGKEEYISQIQIGENYGMYTNDEQTLTLKGNPAGESAIGLDNEGLANPQNNIEADILQLKLKRREYNNLLQKIQGDLSTGERKLH